MTENNSNKKQLRILHFNDVYNAWSKPKGDIVGGGARFTTLVNSYKKGGSNFNCVEPFIFFSGDVWFPSLASQISLGKQMVPIMNALGIHASTIGNHECDSGTDVCGKRMRATNFPWVLSNVRIKVSGKLLCEVEGGTLESLIVPSSDGSLKIGIIGLAEKQWIETLSCYDPSEIIYEDFVECTKRLAPELRKQGADIVVALTHMRVPRDEQLAEEGGDEISLVLGGHDHDSYYSTNEKTGVHVVKSGTDFLDLSVLDIELTKDSENETKPYKMTSYKSQLVHTTSNIPEDPAVAEQLEPFRGDMSASLKKVIGYNGVDLDCRFATIRTRESNVANFVADCIRWNINPKPDIVLVNCGTLRTDAIVPAGPYTVGDLMTMLPMLDFLVVLRITGKQLLEALENGVSQVPALEGRFPMVSGVRFKFDPKQEPGKRVVENSVIVGQDALDLDREYTLVTKEYLAEGRDGYNVFKQCPIQTESEYLPALCACVQRYYLIQKVASHLASIGAKHAANETNVRIAASRWYEKALKRSPQISPRASSSSSSFDHRRTESNAVGTPRQESSSTEPSSTKMPQTTTSSQFYGGGGMGVSPSSVLMEGESPTLHWAVKTFKVNPQVEKRIFPIS